MQPQITKIDDSSLKISTPQPDLEESYTTDDLIRIIATAQARVDKFTALLNQAKGLGIGIQPSVVDITEPLTPQ